MRNFKILTFLLLITTFASCTRREKVDTEFGVIKKPVYGTDIQKTKMKTEAQYLSILSTDLTQLPISPAKLNRAIRVLESIGDRETANEIIISNYMNDPNLSIPPNEYMRQNTEQFIIDTYNKFFIRNPTEAEKTYFLNFINSNNKITVEMVYTAFASSNEYMFY
jgi:hypothetical protein